MGSLKAVASVAGNELTDETRRSLDLSLRYFREAAPKHTADEEISLFPLLRNIDNQELKDALSHLEALEIDHRWAEPLHQLVDELGSEYLNKGRLAPAEADRFRDAVDRLNEMYARHIIVEDTQVFPVAARILTASQKEKIANEMAERRSVKPVQL